MNSIQQNQPEDNHENLSGASAIDKIKAQVKTSASCFFFTTALGHARPMSVQQVDDNGHLWFLSAADSHKNDELLNDPRVRLFFQASAHSGFMELSGVATITSDRNKIKALWQPVLKTWFTGGENDPRITVIKVIPVEGYYWDNKHGNFVAGIKMLIGAALGKTLDDSIEGKIDIPGRTITDDDHERFATD